MLKQGVVDAFLDNLKKRKDSLGQKFKELELEIGNIAIDDLSIDAAEQDHVTQEELENVENDR